MGLQWEEIDSPIQEIVHEWLCKPRPNREVLDQRRAQGSDRRA